MMDMDTPCCTSCGCCNAEYTVVSYKKICKLCSGTLLSPNEMIDWFNDLQAQGLIPPDSLDYITEQVYSREDLDFDDDLLSVENAIARDDAMRDLNNIDWHEEY
jgi:hypothetical protein